MNEPSSQFNSGGAESAEEMMRRAVGVIPHVLELGMQVVHAARGMAIMSLPYQEHLIGNPETGVLHGGVITTLIDSACGLAAVSAPEVPRRVATLDLRIDYLRPATPRRMVFARAEVYKLARDIAFLRAEAYQDDAQDLVAAATGTFMFTSPGPTNPKAKKA
jgi:uncharacterized protein (TIGR00369 family)